MGPLNEHLALRPLHWLVRFPSLWLPEQGFKALASESPAQSVAQVSVRIPNLSHDFQRQPCLDCQSESGQVAEPEMKFLLTNQDMPCQAGLLGPAGLFHILIPHGQKPLCEHVALPRQAPQTSTRGQRRCLGAISYQGPYRDRGQTPLLDKYLFSCLHIHKSVYMYVHLCVNMRANMCLS